jgi:hypothetical protein
MYNCWAGMSDHWLDRAEQASQVYLPHPASRKRADDIAVRIPDADGRRAPSSRRPRAYGGESSVGAWESPAKQRIVLMIGRALVCAS